jgi:predicted nucleotidyltransferase
MQHCVCAKQVNMAPVTSLQLNIVELMIFGSYLRGFGVWMLEMLIFW